MKIDSLHAKLYKFTYISDLPQNFCPYFYKLIFGFIILIPNFILQLPALILNKINKNILNNFNCKDDRISGFFLYCMSILSIIYIHITIIWIKAIFNCYSYNYKDANAGFVINLLIFFALVVIFSMKLYYQHKTKKLEYKIKNNLPLTEEKKENIIIEFIKAYYGKHCPKIYWE